MHEVPRLNAPWSARSLRCAARGMALAFGCALALSGVAALAQPSPQPQMMTPQPAAPVMNEAPSTAKNMARTSLHQEVDFHTSPQRVYAALLDSKQFTAFTGLNATIDRGPGGAFSTFGGLIVGRNIELVPNHEIVQAWRAASWDPGIYSIVRFVLTPTEGGTHLVLDQTAFPAGEFDHLDTGWPVRYWKPLAEYLGEGS